MDIFVSRRHSPKFSRVKKKTIQTSVSRHYLDLSPINISLQKSLSFSNSNSYLNEPTSRNSKIQEAYQFIMLRDIGCSRNQAISLATKFKSSEHHLSMIPREYKEKFRKALEENKYKVFSEENSEILNLTRIRVEKSKSKEKSIDEGKTIKERFGNKKKRKVNLKILNKGQKRKNREVSHTESMTCIKKTENKYEKTQNLVHQNLLPKILPNYQSASNSDRNLENSKKDHFSFESKSLSISKSLEDNYIALLEKERNLMEKIKYNRNHLKIHKKLDTSPKLTYSQEKQNILKPHRSLRQKLFISNSQRIFPKPSTLPVIS